MHRGVAAQTDKHTENNNMSIFGRYDVTPYLTPHKYSKPIIAPSGEPGCFDRVAVDNARIFRHGGRIYMMYIGYDGSGYETALAVTDDMLHWKKLGVILGKNPETGWEAGGRAVSCVMADVDMWGERELYRIPAVSAIPGNSGGNFAIWYHAYPGIGYEAGAAANTIAISHGALDSWECCAVPLFSKGAEGAWDGAGLYSCWVIDREKYYPDSPHRWIMYYNGKNSASWPWNEQVGIAWSDDLVTWERDPRSPVLRVSESGWDSAFSCGQHVLYDSRRGIWVMYYMGFDGRHAGNGIALSEDGISWEKYPEPLIFPGGEGSPDETHAHKPCILYHNGVLYHIFCAVRPTRTPEEKALYGREYRYLTLAASHPVWE